MRWTAMGALGAAVVTGVALTACSSGEASSPASSGGTSGGSAAVQTLTLGAVPSLDLGLIEVAKAQGYFTQAGVDVSIVPVDSGPNVVTGVVAGQYDIGSTAYAPPLLAYGEGAPLQVVTSVGTVGEAGTNSGTLVRKDSGITSWKDLAGKKVASNAPRSLLSLTIPAAVKADGGDPSGIEIVPLPFTQIAKAVEDGQVDAGVSLEPFLTAGLKEYPQLTDLGDSISAALPQGTPSGVYFTSTSTAESKGTAITGFSEAIDKAIVYANAHLDEVKAAGAPLAGLTAEQAQAIPLSPFSQETSATTLKPLVDLMVAFSWLKAEPDLAAFLGSSS